MQILIRLLLRSSLIRSSLFAIMYLFLHIARQHTRLFLFLNIYSHWLECSRYNNVYGTKNNLVLTFMPRNNRKAYMFHEEINIIGTDNQTNNNLFLLRVCRPHVLSSSSKKNNAGSQPTGSSATCDFRGAPKLDWICAVWSSSFL